MTHAIQLSKGLVATVDDADYLVVSQFKWTASKNGGKWYAVRTIKVGHRQYRHQYLHRFLMGEPVGMIVDHKDGDGLHCERANMRVCTKTQNNRNTGAKRNKASRYKGVHWAKDKARWRAYIKLNGKAMGLGHFKDEVEAARAYDLAARQHYGEFARVNFSEQGG